MLFDRELQSQVDDASEHMAMGNSSTNQDVPSLHPSFTAAHGGIDFFPESTASANNAVKLNPRKANDSIGKNREEAPQPKHATKGRAKSRIQLPATAPLVLTKSEESKKRNAHARAIALKREFPDIKGVSDSITKKKRQKLLAQYRASHPDVVVP